MLVKDGEATKKGWKSAQRVVWKELETTLPARLPKNTGKETQQPKTQVPDRETPCWFGEDSSWLGTAGCWMMGLQSYLWVFDPTLGHDPKAYFFGYGRIKNTQPALFLEMLCVSWIKNLLLILWADVDGNHVWHYDLWGLGISIPEHWQ